MLLLTEQCYSGNGYLDSYRAPIAYLRQAIVRHRILYDFQDCITL